MNEENISNATPNERLLVVLSILILLVPLFFVNVPPTTDLPQHLCQIRLLNDTLKGNTDLYIVNWYAPNILIYLLLAFITLLVNPLLAGFITLILIILAWGSSIYFLAKERKRSLIHVALSFIFIYNFTFYWGFLNFLIGWPVFVFWIIYSLKPISKRNRTMLLILSLLLYSSHALWFLFGCIWLFFWSIYRWQGWKSLIRRLSPVIPMIMVSIIWFHLHTINAKEAGFTIAPYSFNSLFDRLTPGYFTNGILGGIRGSVEPILLIIIMIWIIVSLITNRKQIKEKIDFPLLTIAGLFFLIFLFAPEAFVDTLYFSKRWFPIAMILFLLAMPVPTINKKWLYSVQFILLVWFSVQTAAAWSLYEKNELTGLKKSLNALPGNQWVLGLDFIKYSQYVKGRPFLQTFSYAQLFKGGDLNFTFVEHNSGIIRFKEMRKIEWTLNLEWNAEEVINTDFMYFDYALVNAKPQYHAYLSTVNFLHPVTFEGRWRLYKILKIINHPSAP